MNKNNWEREWERETRARNKQLEKIAPWIGYLVMAFNELEERLNEILVELIDDHNEVVGNIIIAGMSFSTKVELLGKIVRSFFGALGSDQGHPRSI